MPAETRPAANPTKLSVLFLASVSSSDCAVAPSWILPVKSLCAAPALVNANAPPPSATTATPAATYATVLLAPEASACWPRIGCSAMAASGTGLRSGFGGVATATRSPLVELFEVRVVDPVLDATAGCSFFAGSLAAGGVVAPGSGRPGNSSVGAEATFFSGSFFE